MVDLIEVEDVSSFASSQDAAITRLMVAGANANAARVAPCLTSADPAPTDAQLDEARLVLVGAVRRWIESGSGALQSQAAGPFSVTTDTRQRTGYNLWPSEIERLQEICSDGTDTSSKAFSITPAGATASHMPWCSLAFGATYCSCGADIAGFPLYEGGALTEDAY